MNAKKQSHRYATDSDALLALKVRGDAVLRDLREITDAAIDYVRVLRLNDVPHSHGVTLRH